MNSMIKLIGVLVVINIFMYVGVTFSISAEGGRELNKDYNFHYEGDIIDQYMAGNIQLDELAEDTKDNWTNYDPGLNANFTQRPQQQAGFTSDNIGILDGLKIAWDSIKLLANVMTAPLTLFFNFRMPVFIGLMIGIPYFIILMLTLVALLRGVGD